MAPRSLVVGLGHRVGIANAVRERECQRVREKLARLKRGDLVGIEISSEHLREVLKSKEERDVLAYAANQAVSRGLRIVPLESYRRNMATNIRLFVGEAIGGLFSGGKKPDEEVVRMHDKTLRNVVVNGYSSSIGMGLRIIEWRPKVNFVGDIHARHFSLAPKTFRVELSPEQVASKAFEVHEDVLSLPGNEGLKEKLNALVKKRLEREKE